ncbi:hypothetical protein TNCV_3629661 [Trichonephila clavipes]|nr:hypothetical protein TNCV_3629661 [Trichonephila clavipes]
MKQKEDKKDAEYQFERLLVKSTWKGISRPLKTRGRRCQARVLMPLTIYHAEELMHVKSVEAQSPPVDVVVWRGNASSGHLTVEPGSTTCHLLIEEVMEYDGRPSGVTYTPHHGGGETTLGGPKLDSAGSAGLSIGRPEARCP